MRNADWQREFASLAAEQLRERVFACVQGEQVGLLEILFSLALEQDTDSGQQVLTLSDIADFHGYLRRTNYRGRLRGGQQAARLLRVNEAEELGEQKIAHLGIITFLAMLRVDKVDPAPEDPSGRQIVQEARSGYMTRLTAQDAGSCSKLLQEMQAEPLDSINAIVFLSFVLVTENAQAGNGAEGFLATLAAQPYVEEIRKILQSSPLLTVLGHESEGRLDDADSGINADFLKMLKSFVNLVWAPVLERFGKEEDKRSV